MKTIILSNYLIYAETTRSQSILRRSRKRWTLALLLGSITGVLTGLSAFAINALSLFGSVADNRLVSQLGAWLIMVFLALMMFLAHCLDKIREANKALRIERSRKH